MSTTTLPEEAPPPPPAPSRSPSPPPPPPPPPQETEAPKQQQPKREIKLPTSYKTNLKTLLSYPPLIPHEHHLSKSRYDVKSWYLYLCTINHLLSSLTTLHEDNTKLLLKTKGRNSAVNDFILGSSRDDIGGGDGTSNLTIRANNLPNEIYKLNISRLFVSQRALALLPGSYKLWKDYLDFILETFFIHQQHHLCNYVAKFKRRINHTINAFELSLRQRMNKMPRIWIMYITFLQCYTPNDISTIRRLYNRAFMSLPTTQHDIIWKECNDWLTSTNNKVKIPTETKLKLLYRYTHEYDLSKRETYIKTCMQYNEYGEAAKTLLTILNEDDYTSPNAGCTKAKLWNQFVKLCTSHPSIIESSTNINFDLIIRNQLSSAKYKDMKGYLWNNLALYYIKNGDYEIGRSIYEEALEDVDRVRDFSIVFDSYMSLEEGVISALMTLQNEDDDANNDDDKMEMNDDDQDDLNILLDNKDNNNNNNEHNSKQHSSYSSSSSNNTEMELALARAEYLMERRPLLLNRVLLRQNPHNVLEWINRSKLFIQLNQISDAISSLQNASTKIISKQSMNGSPCTVFIQLATIYENNCMDIESARGVYQRICHYNDYKFHNVDDLAQCYASWIEMELRHDNFDEALRLSRLSVAKQPSNCEDSTSKRLFKSLRVWNLLLDLEESLGTIQTTKSSYSTCLEWGIATPSILFNYADFLINNSYFEEAFTVYEKGVDTFSSFPIIGKLWKNYTTSFVTHYKGSKIERTRDLYERCLDCINNETKSSQDESDCVIFYLDYSKFEDKYGKSFTSRILSIYERLCTFITISSYEKYVSYQLYITKVSYYLGITKTRPIYERAIESIQDLLYVIKTCLDYANMELSLNEIDRARAIFIFGSQYANPNNKNSESDIYYKSWQDFEIEYGNEDTFREMLRIKRSVVIKYSTDVNYNHTAEEKDVEDATASKFLEEDEALQMIAHSEGLGDVTSAETRKRHYEDVLKDGDLDDDEGNKKETKFVKSSNDKEGGSNALQTLEERVSKLKEAVDQPLDQMKDDDEIDLDDDEIDLDNDDDDGDNNDEEEIVENQKEMGALERLQMAAAK